MIISTRPLLPALLLSIVGFSVANTAHAGCGYVPPKLEPNAWSPVPQAPSMLRAAYYWQGAGGRLQFISDNGFSHEPADIVGLWRFQLVTPGPNGAVVDDGYAQWHSDGTEIQNSGLHAPITSNFCLGVWKQVGRNTYQLNHFPLAWDTSGQTPANAIRLTQTVHLTDADHMTGTFTLKVYVWTTTDSLNVAPGGPVATVTGTITATRVTIDTDVPGGGS